MIANARIIKINRRTSIGPDGSEAFTPGTAVSIPCSQQGVTRQQRIELQAKISDANWTIYVDEDELAAAGQTAPAQGDQVLVVMDTPVGEDGADADAVMGQVLLERPWRQLSISHRELYLQDKDA